MTALAPAPADQAASAEAVVVAAEITAGHDGTAELALSICYENGVTSSVVLDADTGFSIMRACGASDLAALVGRPWRDISKGL